MKRRNFLELSFLAAASVSAGPLLQACSKLMPETTEKGSPIPDAFKEVAAREGGRSLSLFIGAKEFEKGPSRIPFVLVDRNNAAISRAQGTMRAARAGSIVANESFTYRTYGPRPDKPRDQLGATPPAEKVFDQPGFYDSQINLEGEGFWDLMVTATSDGKKYLAFAAIEVGESKVPSKGEPAVPVVTPTDSDPRGVAFVCTREPACGMHSVSLDAALTSGKPTILTIATPRFCTSRLCGPIVDEVMAVRNKTGDGPNYIHAEVFSDVVATNYTQAMDAWNLDTEPWTFVIDSNGVVTDRFEGPVTAPQLDLALNEATR